MKISMKLSVIMSAVFAVVCFGVAITGFVGLRDVTDPVQRSDGQGFALFWAFLGAVATALGALGLWILRTEKEES